MLVMLEAESPGGAGFTRCVWPPPQLPEERAAEDEVSMGKAVEVEREVIAPLSTPRVGVIDSQLLMDAAVHVLWILLLFTLRAAREEEEVV